jgi:predicted DNA binding protein
MTTILKASVPADQFALAETFETIPDVEFDAVRLVSNGTDRVVPLLWATNADASAVYEAIENDDTTTNTRLVSRRNHDALFQMHWTTHVRFLTHVLVEERGAIVSARGTSEGWTFRILFPEREAVSTTYDACAEYDVDVEQLTSLPESQSLGGFSLTDEQFETVEAAVSDGYYDVPRQTTLEELASDLDVSHQALSERLRRGHRTLIESVIAP